SDGSENGCRFTSPSPRLRGEGRGEGDSPQVRFVETPPHPKFALRANFDLSPQAGRGGPNAGIDSIRGDHALREKALASISFRICRLMPLLVREASCHHQPSRFIFPAAATKRSATAVKSASV